MDSEDEFSLPDLVTPPITKKGSSRPRTKKKKSNDSSDDEIEFDFGAHERRVNSSHEDSDVASSPRGKLFRTYIMNSTWQTVWRKLRTTEKIPLR